MSPPLRTLQLSIGVSKPLFMESQHLARVSGKSKTQSKIGFALILQQFYIQKLTISYLVLMKDDAEHMREHWKQHWRLTVVGSSIGIAAIIANFLYLLLTDRFPSFLEGEIFEFVIFAIPLLIFLWFIRVAIWEYKEIKGEKRME
jgi:hypothetical protein